ncbi:hypothetical protein ABH958_005538 [Bacillus sp. RC250]
MNLSIQDEFHLFAEELKRYLSPHILQQLAQETGFVKRKSKYGARDLAALCIWISQQYRYKICLNNILCLEKETFFEIHIKKKSQRYFYRIISIGDNHFYFCLL